MRVNPVAMMGNNPLAMLMRAAQVGGDPMQIIWQMAGNNPQMRRGMQMVQGKNPQQLEQMARNMARERGADVRDIMHSLGIEE